MAKNKSNFIRYIAIIEDDSMMRGRGTSFNIVYKKSDKAAIKWAKKHFKDGNSGIWSSLLSLVLTAEYSDKEVVLLRLSLPPSLQMTPVQIAMRGINE